MIVSSIFIDPLVGSSMSDIKFNKVDLPDPEGPVMEYIFPFSKIKLIRRVGFVHVLSCRGATAYRSSL